MFEEIKLDVLGLSKARMRGEGEISYEKIREYNLRVRQRGIAIESVTVLLSKYIWRFMKEIRYLSLRIIYAKLSISRECWSAISAYAKVEDVIGTFTVSILNENGGKLRSRMEKRMS